MARRDSMITAAIVAMIMKGTGVPDDSPLKASVDPKQECEPDQADPDQGQDHRLAERHDLGLVPVGQSLSPGREMIDPEYFNPEAASPSYPRVAIESEAMDGEHSGI